MFYSSKPGLANKWPFLSSLATVIVITSFLCYFFELYWQTNDDVGMSMIAHGYGIATLGSPNILFSNVLWGYLVRGIPTIHGIFGYSIATITVLLVSGTVLFYSLLRLGRDYLTSFLILTLILVPAFLFPQFTINAGLLMLAAITCALLYARERDWRFLVLGTLLAFFSYLERGMEFWLILIIALPLLPWRFLLTSRAAKIATAVLLIAMAISAVIDHQAYQGEEWKAYNTLNPVRALFTDYGAGERLKQHEDILEKYGYTHNDIDLISNWFFVDSELANPQKLGAALKKLGPLPFQAGAINKGWSGILFLSHDRLYVILLAALLLVLLRPTREIIACWLLCVTTVFTLGLLGRPGVLHILVPAVDLLLIAPFLSKDSSSWPKYSCFVILFMAALINTYHVFLESKNKQVIGKQIHETLVGFPDFPVVIWGASFPYELVYSVLRESSSAAISYKHYGLGTSTLAPFTIASSEQKAGRGMVNQLTQENGVSLISDSLGFKMLEIYCKEHFSGELQGLSSRQFGELSVNQVRCKLNT